MTTHEHVCEETPDLSHLGEREWLAHWGGILAELEQHRHELARAGVTLPRGPAAQLDGRAEMLRAVLASRSGVPGP